MDIDHAINICQLIYLSLEITSCKPLPAPCALEKSISDHVTRINTPSVILLYHVLDDAKKISKAFWSRMQGILCSEYLPISKLDNLWYHSQPTSLLGFWLCKVPKVSLWYLTVWDITWISGQVHALGRVDGSTWTSDCCAPGQVPPPTDHLIKCHWRPTLRLLVTQIGPCVCLSERSDNLPHGTWRHSAKWYPRLLNAWLNHVNSCSDCMSYNALDSFFLKHGLTCLWLSCSIFHSTGCYPEVQSFWSSTLAPFWENTPMIMVKMSTS